MTETGVEFAQVCYTIADSAEAPGRVLFRDLSLHLDAGSTTALLGRSGSGKTTLLRMVNGLVRPTAGKVFVQGKAVNTLNLRGLRRSTGYVIQENGLFPHMSVEKNCGLPLELSGTPRNEIARRVAEVLQLVGLHYEDLRDRYPWQLSGGQRQRVGLARALASDPPTLLMDEPLGALDPITRAEMQTMLRGLLSKFQKTVLLVTHDLNEALYMAQRVVFLEQGQIAADLPAEEVQRSEQVYVKEYVSAVSRTSLEPQ